MAEWTLTEKGRELLEEYVTEDIGFSVNDILDGKLFRQVQDDSLIEILDGKLDRKSVYATQAVSMKQLANCFTRKSVVWGIKMNLLIGIILYKEEPDEKQITEKLSVTEATVNEHLALLESCFLIKKKDVTTHISDFI
jgi:hypothetical protein